jgi:hypothetical protein
MEAKEIVNEMNAIEQAFVENGVYDPDLMWDALKNIFERLS